MIVAVGIVDLAGLGAVDLGGDCHQVARCIASGGHLSGAAGCGGAPGVGIAGLFLELVDIVISVFGNHPGLFLVAFRIDLIAIEILTVFFVSQGEPKPSLGALL